MTVEGVPISPEECLRRWRPWTPQEVRDRLAAVDAPWGVAGGWAIDLHLGAVTREHDDIEITVPRASFPAVAAALSSFRWDVVGDGRLWPYPAALERFHQTWLREPATGEYHLDVFREAHRGSHWTYRRDPSITLPYDCVYRSTADGIPYVMPEIVLLFKAPHVRPKDQADFERVVGALPEAGQERLAGWIRRLDAHHPWLTPLTR